MSQNIITRDDCARIISKLVRNKGSEVEIIDYDYDRYCDGYPGFLGDYFSLNIRFNNVSNSNFM